MENDKPAQLFALIVRQLRDLRTAQALSHEQLARAAGITRPAVSYIESGKRKPSLLVALRLAEALGKSLSEIVKRAEEGEPAP